MSEHDELDELIAEATAWLNESPDDDKTERVSERVVSLIGRLADALEAATAPAPTVRAELLAEVEAVIQRRISDLKACGKSDDCEVQARGAWLASEDVKWYLGGGAMNHEGTDHE